MATISRGRPSTAIGGGGARRRPDYMAIQDVDRFPTMSNRSCARPASAYYAFPKRTPRVLHPLSLAGGVLVMQWAHYRAVIR